MKKIIMYCVMFLIMYRPAVFWIKPSVYLTVFVLFFLFIKVVHNKMIVNISSIYFKLISSLFFFLGYLCLVSIVQNGDYSFMNSFLQLALSLVLVCLMYDFYKIQINKSGLDMLYNLCLIQSFFCILMLIFAPLHELYSSIAVAESDFVASFDIIRTYGVAGATEYPFGIGLVHGVVGLIYINKIWGEVNFKHLCILFLLLIPCILDTRTGLIVFILCILTKSIVSIHISPKIIYKSLLYIIYVLVGGYALLYALENLLPEYYSWVSILLEIFMALLNNDQSAKVYEWYGGLLPINWDLPQGGDLIIGMGKIDRMDSLYYAGMYDSGMYRMICYGGVLLVLFTFIILYKMLKSVNIVDGSGRYINFGGLCYAFIIIANFKGDAVLQSSFMSVVLFVVLYCNGQKVINV